MSTSGAFKLTFPFPRYFLSFSFITNFLLNPSRHWADIKMQSASLLIICSTRKNQYDLVTKQCRYITMNNESLFSPEKSRKETIKFIHATLMNNISFVNNIWKKNPHVILKKEKWVSNRAPRAFEFYQTKNINTKIVIIRCNFSSSPVMPNITSTVLMALCIIIGRRKVTDSNVTANSSQRVKWQTGN